MDLALMFKKLLPFGLQPAMCADTVKGVKIFIPKADVPA
jgi:hypothetical protein